MILNVLMLIFNLFLSPSEDKIEWSENTQLTWEDFKGKPYNSYKHDALSKLEISYWFNVPREGSAQVEIKAIFYKKSSWVKPKEKTESLLSHENLHFDIAEVFARKVRKEIKAYYEKKGRSKASKLNKKFSKIYNMLYDDYEKYQQLYDKETAYSTNKKEQARWKEKIKRELIELEEYAKSVVEINLS
ncbi:MAG: hypothetical protein CMC96_08065 [Flavobacteriales bacterium]|nr:hypothetical protein [Flavobacteriales bacterium]|tara:strand:+ start:53935 stop:54498 length:564 start_codon:yes stop_codon:yes gene_type:complete